MAARGNQEPCASFDVGLGKRRCDEPLTAPLFLGRRYATRLPSSIGNLVDGAIYPICLRQDAAKFWQPGGPERATVMQQRPSMNHKLFLSLELLEQASWRFRFRLLAVNQSAVKLMLPYPEVIGLRFANADTAREAEWYTSLLVSASGGGFTLDPAESRIFEWKVRPCSVERPDSNEGYFEYYRWCVELSAGEYQVWYQWRVNSEFFDPDSHMRLEDLERLAEREKAVTWQGQAVSNRLRVVAA